MTYLGSVPFFEHPLENLLFIIAVGLIAAAAWAVLFIVRRKKSSVTVKKRDDDQPTPWETMEENRSENIAGRKK